MTEEYLSIYALMKVRRISSGRLPVKHTRLNRRRSRSIGIRLALSARAKGVESHVLAHESQSLGPQRRNDANRIVGRARKPRDGGRLSYIYPDRLNRAGMKKLLI